MPKSLRNKLQNHLLICCFLSISYSAVSNSQENGHNAYQLFDEIIGKTNSGIFNGIQYYEKFQVKSDKHQFFKHKFFIYGSLLYQNQPYFDLSLKYDVHADELLVKNPEVMDAPITLLDKQYVHQFNLNGHLFKNLSFSIKQGKVKAGFYEVLYETALISIFKKHQKKISRTVDGEISYEFKDQFQYYIRHKNAYHPLRKANSLTSIFPANKTHLKSSFKQYANLRKTDFDKYLISIITALNTHILNTN